jgi:hypothetical protein
MHIITLDWREQSHFVLELYLEQPVSKVYQIKGNASKVGISFLRLMLPPFQFKLGESN